MSDSGKQNFLDWKYEEVASLRLKPLSKEDFIEEENSALVAVTRMESVRDSSIDDVEDAADSMIVRACDNHDRLGLPRTAKMLEFRTWFYEHVVGA